MRDTGLIEFRRHDPDVIGQRADDLLDNLQAGSMDAVVVGAEDSHRFKMPCSVDSTSGQGAVLSFSCRRGKPGNIEQKGSCRVLARHRSDRAKARALSLPPCMI